MIRVLVTGAGGFVGRAVVDELLARKYEVRALVHKRPIDVAGVTSVRGDLLDGSALDRAIEGCGAVIHLVGIIMENPAQGVTFQRIHFEGTRSVVDAAVRNGARRFIHMSALGTRAGARSDYHKTKFAAEEYVRKSGLDWTIIQPSMIHGPAGDFMHQEAAWARKKAMPYLFMPYFGRGLFGGGGAGRLQPVYVTDVARAFVEALEKPQTVGKTYELAGSQQLTWPEFHRICANAIVGKDRLVMPIPAWKALLWTHLLPQSWLGFNRDQVLMSQEDNTADLAGFEKDFGWRPGAFAEQLGEYAGQL